MIKTTEANINHNKSDEIIVYGSPNCTKVLFLRLMASIKSFFVNESSRIVKIITTDKDNIFLKIWQFKCLLIIIVANNSIDIIGRAITTDK